MKFIAVLFLTVSCFFLLSAHNEKDTKQNPATPTGKPNIIFILTDDHRWDALGFAGNPIIKTPYLDKVVDYEALSVQRNAPRWLKMLIKHGYMPAPA